MSEWIHLDAVHSAYTLWTHGRCCDREADQVCQSLCMYMVCVSPMFKCTRRYLATGENTMILVYGSSKSIKEASVAT
jgi:hypothetical protein